MMVPDDLRCRRCCYSLRTLTWDARCPECGEAVRESRLPESLRFSSWRELRRVRGSVVAIVVSCLVGVVIPAALVTYVLLLGFEGPRVIMTSAYWAFGWGTRAANVSALVAIAAAVWPSDPRLPPYAVRCGWVVVAAVVAGVLMQLGGVFIDFVVTPNAAFPWTLECVLFAASHGVALVLVWPCLAARLERRAPRVLLVAAGLAACTLFATYLYVSLRAFVSTDRSWSNVPFISVMLLFPNLCGFDYDLLAALCWIIMLLAALRFIRTVDKKCAAMRATEPGAPSAAG